MFIHYLDAYWSEQGCLLPCNALSLIFFAVALQTVAAMALHMSKSLSFKYFTDLFLLNI